MREDIDLVKDYLMEIGMPGDKIIDIIGLLWNDDESIFQYLQYVAETKETDYDKLYSMVYEITGEDPETELELNWNKMWVLWMNKKMESPYQEILSYETDVRNGSHLEYFNWIKDNENFEKTIDIVSKNLKGTVLETIFNQAYDAYQKIEKSKDEAEQILSLCDKAFANEEDAIEKYLETIASKIDL